MRECYLLARFVQRENEQCVHTLVAMCAMIQCACTTVSVAAAGIQVVVVVEWSSLKLFPGGLPDCSSRPAFLSVHNSMMPHWDHSILIRAFVFVH
jgi:hypothetical protein